MTERHITQKQPVRKDEIPGAFFSGAPSCVLSRKTRRKCTRIGLKSALNRHLAGRSIAPSASFRRASTRAVLRQKTLQTLDTRVQPRRIAGIAPAHETLALRTKGAAGRHAQAHFAHHGLA